MFVDMMSKFYLSQIFAKLSRYHISDNTTTIL